MPVPDVQFDDLYRELILEHYRSPRNRGTLTGATHAAEGLNPTCGDEIRIEALLADGRIADVRFSGQGCSISQASASMLTELVAGKPIDDAGAIMRKFEAMLVEGAEADPVIGDMEAFHGVAKFHARIKCATLAAKVLDECLTTPVAQREEAKDD